MEIGITQKNGISSRSGKIPQGATVIAQKLKKQSVYLDKDGNQYDSLDPKTRRIIKKKSE